MADHPLKNLAETIAARLAAEGIVQESRTCVIAQKIALGKMAEDDWYFELEQQLLGGAGSSTTPSIES